MVEGVGGDDGRDRIEERERCGGEPPRDRRGEGVGGERAGGDDGRGEQVRHLLAHQGDVGVTRDPVVHSPRERQAIDCERRAARHARRVRRLEHDAPEPPHLGLEQAVSVRQLH